MLSLDVTALFTNVPLDDVLNFLVDQFNSGVLHLPIPIDSFVSLVRLCVDNNYFSFGDSFYRQIYGVAMGSPLSPVLANLNKEYLEKSLLPTLNSRPLFWLRYVDDIFALWPNDANFDSFFTELNSLSPRIKFTVEWETDSRLAFLDVNVIRNHNHFQFSVFRKPTHSGLYLHFFSWHPQHVKRSVVYSMFLRALRICDPVFLEDEFSYIKNSLHKLAYPNHFIARALSDAKQKFYSVAAPQPRDHHMRTMSLPFNNVCRELIEPILNSHDIRVTYKNCSSLRSKLVKTKPPCISEDGSGVYVVPCSDCPDLYIGETGRTLATRLKEHKSYVRYAKQSSAIFNHVHSQNHNINWNASKIVYHSNDIKKRLIVESSLIQQIPNFNLMGGVCSIDRATKNIILASNPDILNNLPPPD